MAISGTTNTCEITTNTQFVLSGLSETNLSTINITDENGLDVSECFGIETRIITVVGDNVTLTGDCNTSLEILITDGVTKEVSCDFIRFTQDDTNFLTFYFSDGSSSDNTHPDCCTALGFTPEIGPDCYYICRWRDEIDSTDCNNYQATGTFDKSLHQIFEYAGGGTTTTVPSVDCCYINNLIEEELNGEIYCIEDVPFDPCLGLEVIEPTPDFGIIQFLNPTTGSILKVVENSECCTSNGFSFQIVDGGFQCFNSLTSNPPTVTLSITDSCCEPNSIDVTDPTNTGTSCIGYDVIPSSGILTLTYSYTDCDNVRVKRNISNGDTASFCAIEGSVSMQGSGSIIINPTRFCQP